MKLLSCHCRHLQTLLYTTAFFLMIMLLISAAFMLIGE